MGKHKVNFKNLEEKHPVLFALMQSDESFYTKDNVYFVKNIFIASLATNWYLSKRQSGKMSSDQLHGAMLLLTKVLQDDNMSLEWNEGQIYIINTENRGKLNESRRENTSGSMGTTNGKQE